MTFGGRRTLQAVSPHHLPMRRRRALSGLPTSGFPRFLPGVMLVAAVLAPAGIAPPARAQSRVTPAGTETRPALGWTDLMRLPTLAGTVVSDDGSTVATVAQPDRGDAEGLVVRTAPVATGRRASGAPATPDPIRIPRAASPAVSADGRFAAFLQTPPLAEAERLRLKKSPASEPGAILVDAVRGVSTTWTAARRFAFAPDGRTFALLHGPPDTTRLGDVPPRRTTRADTLMRGFPLRKGEAGRRLLVRDLVSGRDVTLRGVREFAFSDDGRTLVYAVAHRDTTADGLFARDLDSGATTVLDRRTRGAYPRMAWSRSGTLAFLAARDRADGTPGDADLRTWRAGEPAAALRIGQPPTGWTIPPDSRLTWTDDGQRLFVGLRPAAAPASADTAFAPLDVSAILRERGVDVWGAHDARIQPQQKVQFDERRRRLWTALLDIAAGTLVPLDSGDVLLADVPQNPRTALARDAERHAAEASWDRGYADLYAVDLATGRRRRVAEHVDGPARLTPDGRAIVRFGGRAWQALDTATGAARTLGGPDTPLADEEHDSPDPAPAYGLAAFVGADSTRAALVYDRYDVWALALGGGPPSNVTGGEGRRTKTQLRIAETDPDRRAYAHGDTLLLTGYDEAAKTQGLWRVVLGRPESIVRLAPGTAPDDRGGETSRGRPRGDAPGRIGVVVKAKRAPLVVITRESYRAFPDLYATDLSGAAPRRLTDASPDARQFAWGRSELVRWQSTDGEAREGVVILPDGYDASKRYPVLVYFYERMNDRLNVYPATAVTHRPVLPQYVGEGVVVFLPDVAYEVGRPGLSALKSILPGVQMLIDRGIADGARIGLHGHSWSGYQTAWLVTQTNRFVAAAAGAPVANMTSAYGGIRWETGVSRQFQYEQTQSRLGATLWEARDRYIDNSPLFFADRVATPLLLLHGDADGAVPWEQSIEFYLALRRLGKDVTFVQYRGEGHHPKAYANKLDWAMRLHDFFGHYLLGRPAPAWMTEGAPYAGK